MYIELHSRPKNLLSFEENDSPLVILVSTRNKDAVQQQALVFILVRIWDASLQNRGLSCLHSTFGKVRSSEFGDRQLSQRLQETF